ncbi:GDSL-type esterase/lipase family protein [Streptomyces gobiensis]|nr:SGNH/GDSL hydrolase family protein [Streptomyces gobiensis]UGY95027.1 GDSL-type esterase/lipase family protein [Streptomyces gobiensis]
MTVSLAGVACGSDSGVGPRDATGSAGPPSSPSPTLEWNRSPDSIAALGDSITTAFDACSLLSDCPEASWATGTSTEIDSLAQRLLPDPAGKTWNYASSGAVMADLPGQAQQAVARQPELVTVLIGANDACSADVSGMTSTQRFREDFTEAMGILRDELPKTQVYVASVPDLMRLWSEGRKSSQAEQAWEFGICKSMLRDPHSMTKDATERREQVAKRVSEYNTVLKEVCSTDERCRYDDGAVHKYRFTAAELSPLDWFHPSKRGQRTLARLAYEGITAK